VFRILLFSQTEIRFNEIINALKDFITHLPSFYFIFMWPVASTARRKLNNTKTNN